LEPRNVYEETWYCKVDGINGIITHMSDDEYVVMIGEGVFMTDFLRQFHWEPYYTDSQRARLPKNLPTHIRAYGWRRGTLQFSREPFRVTRYGQNPAYPEVYTAYESSYYLWQGKPVAIGGSSEGDTHWIETEDRAFALAHGFQRCREKPVTFRRQVPRQELQGVWEQWSAKTRTDHFVVTGETGAAIIKETYGVWPDMVPKRGVEDLTGCRFIWEPYIVEPPLPSGARGGQTTPSESPSLYYAIETGMTKMNGCFATYRGRRVECCPMWGSDCALTTSDPVVAQALSLEKTGDHYSGRAPMLLLKEFCEEHWQCELDGRRRMITHESDDEYIIDMWDREPLTDYLKQFSWERYHPESLRARIPKQHAKHVRCYGWRGGAPEPADSPCFGAHNQAQGYQPYMERYGLWRGHPVDLHGREEETCTISTEDRAFADAHDFRPTPYSPTVYQRTVPVAELVRVWDFWSARTSWNTVLLVVGETDTAVVKKWSGVRPEPSDFIPKTDVRVVKGLRLKWTPYIIER
jgi:hypothetical protein